MQEGSGVPNPFRRLKATGPYSFDWMMAPELRNGQVVLELHAIRMQLRSAIKNLNALTELFLPDQTVGKFRESIYPHVALKSVIDR
jgi:hypothetical protein